MKIRVIVLMVVTTISISVFAQKKGELKTVFESMNKEMMSLTIAGKFESLAKFYQDDVVSLPNNRPMDRGFKQMLALNQQRNKSGYKIIEGRKEITDLIVNDNLAVEVGTYTYKSTFPGPAEPVVTIGKYMTVWNKQNDGSWKIVAESWNTDQSPVAPKQGGPPAREGDPPAQQPSMDVKDGQR